MRYGPTYSYRAAEDIVSSTATIYSNLIGAHWFSGIWYSSRRGITNSWLYKELPIKNVYFNQYSHFGKKPGRFPYTYGQLQLQLATRVYHRNVCCLNSLK